MDVIRAKPDCKILVKTFYRLKIGEVTRVGANTKAACNDKSGRLFITRMRKLENDFLFPGQFLLNQPGNCIQMIFLMSKIQVVRTDLQYRTEIKSFHPIIVK